MKKLLMCSLFLIICTQMLGGTKNVSIDFELNETAINRAIVSQFNDPNLPFKHFTGTFKLLGVLNVPYSVKLERPTIVIENNSIGINMAFTFEASIGSTPYNYSFDVTPSISVKDASISGSNVVAFLDDLDNKINETNMEEDIKVLLIGLYEVFEPQIYARDLFNEILDEINSNEFIAQRAFSITGFGISSALVPDKFVIKVSVEVTYASSYFGSFIVYKNNDNEYIRFSSNIKCRVKSIVIRDFNQSELYRNESTDILLTYNPNYAAPYFAELNLGDIVSATQARYTWQVLFETSETFYFNEYYAPASEWAYPAKNINN